MFDVSANRRESALALTAHSGDVRFHGESWRVTGGGLASAGG
jgi:hypothetical protein